MSFTAHAARHTRRSRQRMGVWSVCGDDGNTDPMCPQRIVIPPAAVRSTRDLRSVIIIAIHSGSSDNAGAGQNAGAAGDWSVSPKVDARRGR